MFNAMSLSCATLSNEDFNIFNQETCSKKRSFRSQSLPLSLEDAISLPDVSTPSFNQLILDSREVITVLGLQNQHS
jgi:hypothetical protein